MSVLEMALVALCLLCVLLNIVSLPGNLAPLLVLVGYFFFGPDGAVSGKWLLAAGLIFLSAELVEQVSSLVGARLFGGSRAGMLGAFLGGIVGAILGSLALPILGTIVGVFLGCFLFAVLFELGFGGKGLWASLKSGFGSLLGRVFALAFKYAAGFALVALLAVRLAQS